MELVALMPWWAGVGLAVTSYFFFHSVATQAPPDYQPGQVGALMARWIWQGFAGFAQYVVPLVCMAGAGVSAWRRRERKALVTDMEGQSDAADILNGMSWRQFEVLVGEMFRLKGYSVSETGGGGADGGVDLLLTKGREKFIVQCKQWRAFRVGVDVVRELYGVMAAHGASGGFVVTSGRFTRDASEWAGGRNITLIDGSQLPGLIGQAQVSGIWSSVSPSSSSPPLNAAPPAAAVPVEPACPVCSKPMIRRAARRGANKGSEFWGCTSYPACRGTRPIQ